MINHTTPSDLDHRALAPWVSFCIATYCRGDILKQTLGEIKKQTFLDFEVIVSDNDPKESSRKIVEELNDERFLYFSNSENVGMVKNFNVALKNATGKFVVMIADDDPPKSDFLEIMHCLWQNNPEFGAYFGACEVVFASEDAAKAYKVEMGSIKFLANAPEGAIRYFSRDQFPEKFFKYKVFPYTLWSCGIVRRDIATEIGGMPDYGSPLLTDLAYVAVVSSYAGCATINTVMGGQTIHGNNSGLVNPHDVESALLGCQNYLKDKLTVREDWPKLEGLINKFLAIYISNHCLAMHEHFSNNNNKAEIENLKFALNRMFHFHGMSKMRFYFFRTLIINKAKKNLGPLIPVLKHMRSKFKYIR